MSITRVQYRERQRLTAVDLRTEQDYRLGIAGRHHISHHRGGVVRGLRVVARSSTTWTLMPGVAIDGYGREILVPNAVDLPTGNPEACWFVLLYYCEYPEQVPPDRSCKDDPAPRTGHRFRVVLADDFSPRSEMPPDIDRARAAGSLRDLSSWPILVARVGKDCDGAPKGDGIAIDYSATSYVGHRASMIWSPTGRAMFQLGLSSRSDNYHMLLSTVDEGNTLSRRLGIDRDGAAHIWRPLFISGAEAVGESAVSGNKTLLVSTAMPAGLGARVLLQGRFNASATILSMSLLDLGVTRPKRIENDIELPKGQPLPGEVVLGKARLVSFNLIDRAGSAIASLSGVDRIEKSQEFDGASGLNQFSIELKPFGGALVIRRPESPQLDVPVAGCGEVERFRNESDELGGGVVQFKPGSEIAADPIAREIQAVTTSQPTERVPRSELRISGGGADDSDALGRVTIGAQVSGAWTPAMRMNGRRGLTMPIGPDSQLALKGTVYLPAIGKNDLLLPDLMAKAFVRGLRQMGRLATQVTLELIGVPASIVRGEDLKYTLKITLGGNQVADVKRCLELISGTTGNKSVAIRTIPELPAQITPTNSPFTLAVNYKRFRHRASNVRIEVELLVSIAGLPLVAVKQSPEIAVGDPIPGGVN